MEHVCSLEVQFESSGPTGFQNVGSSPVVVCGGGWKGGGGGTLEALRSMSTKLGLVSDDIVLKAPVADPGLMRHLSSYLYACKATHVNEKPATALCNIPCLGYTSHHNRLHTWGFYTENTPPTSKAFILEGSTPTSLLDKFASQKIRCKLQPESGKFQPCKSTGSIMFFLILGTRVYRDMHTILNDPFSSTNVA